jgi:hypothetical protein
MGGKLVLTPFEETWTKPKPFDEWMMGLVDELSG